MIRLTRHTAAAAARSFMRRALDLNAWQTRQKGAQELEVEALAFQSKIQVIEGPDELVNRLG